MGGKVIALCGKGGVGKTTLAAMLATHLTRGPRKCRVLAVDADHTGGLSMALGLPVTKTLNDIRLEVTNKLREGSTSKRSAPQALDYLLLGALVEHGSLALLAAGRPEERGCFCSLNTFLRESIGRLASQFDITIIDAEAGVEQVNRDVIASVDQLLLVSDTSAKGLRVAETLRSVVKGLDHKPTLGLIVNRVRTDAERGDLRSRTTLPFWGSIPEDDTIRIFDAEERSYLELPSCPALDSVEGISETIGGVLATG
jgi:CO dehydrogenase maturation factor